MKSFFHFAPELLRYKTRLVILFGAALLEAAFSLGGFGALMKIIDVFLGEQKSLKAIVTEARAHWIPEALFGPMKEAEFWVNWLPEDGFYGFVILVVFVWVMVICGNSARFTHQYISIDVCWRAIMNIRARLYHRMIFLSMTTLDQERVSDKISRILVDCSSLSRGYQAILGRAMRDVFQGSVAFIVAIFVSWEMTLLFLISVPLIGVVLAVFGKRIRKATRRTMKYVGILLGNMTESLQALQVVKLHQTEGYERRRFNRANRILFKTEMRARVAKAASSPLTEVIGITGVILIAIIAAFMVYRHGEDPETLVKVLVALGISAASFSNLAKLNNDFQEAGGAADRIIEALDLPVEPRPLQEHQEGLPALARHRDHIKFNDLSFTYPSANEASLSQISLHVSHGQTVAIVGPNGSGKSTLLNLLPRLYDPQEGEVLIDGQDISKVTLKSLRKQVAVVTQKTVLFAGSISDNLTYGSRHNSREAMIAASKQAYAHEFISELPENYDSELGEQGSRLSGGQRQRIAIARAILRNPSILILDEATSQIDSESEVKINEALSEFSKDRTTFVIAHRMSTVVNADQIVVMNEGQIECIGKHQQLLEDSETYQILCKTQLAAG